MIRVLHNPSGKIVLEGETLSTIIADIEKDLQTGDRLIWSTDRDDDTIEARIFTDTGTVCLYQIML